MPYDESVKYFKNDQTDRPTTLKALPPNTSPTGKGMPTPPLLSWKVVNTWRIRELHPIVLSKTHVCTWQGVSVCVYVES